MLFVFFNLSFLFFDIFEIATFKVFLTIKGTFTESLRSLAQKLMKRRIGEDKCLVIF